MGLGLGPKDAEICSLSLSLPLCAPSPHCRAWSSCWAPKAPAGQKAGVFLCLSLSFFLLLSSNMSQGLLYVTSIPRSRVSLFFDKWFFIPL